MVKLPEDIAETLAVQWPKQFTLEPDATETTERVFGRALQSFARNVGRIIDRGVTVEQILVLLDQLANEPKYRLMDRGTILKRLWTLVPQDRAPQAPRPVRERVAHPAVSGGSPAIKALRACPDIEDAPTRYAWLGRPSGDGKYRRNIDRPFWRDLHASFHRTAGGVA